VVAVVFAATNRQFAQVIPSYTLACQALLIVGLTLASATAWQQATAWISGRGTRVSRRAAR
jgi:hypothetical protein